MSVLCANLMQRCPTARGFRGIMSPDFTKSILRGCAPPSPPSSTTYTSIRSYNSTSIHLAKSRVPAAPKSVFSTKPGGVDPLARAERNKKRLRSQVIKALQSDIKSSSRSKQAQELAKKFITHTAGFTINDTLGDPTVRLQKIHSITQTRSVRVSGVGISESRIPVTGSATPASAQKQLISLEFESYDELPGREQSIFLIDVIISNIIEEAKADSNTSMDGSGNSGDGSSGEHTGSRLVLTCTADRSSGFQVLSVRNVPAGVRCVCACICVYVCMYVPVCVYDVYVCTRMHVWRQCHRRTARLLLLV